MTHRENKMTIETVVHAARKEDKFLIESILIHLADDRVSEDAKMLVIAPTAARLKYVKDSVVSKLKMRDAWRITMSEVMVNRKKVYFRSALQKDMVRGFMPDYVFIFDSDQINDDFKMAIEPLRTHAIFIETGSTIME